MLLWKIKARTFACIGGEGSVSVPEQHRELFTGTERSRSGCERNDNNQSAVDAPAVSTDEQKLPGNTNTA